MSNFWSVYASVNDDIRHKIVEEGVYGRQQTGDITREDMPGIEPASAEPEHYQLYEQTWGPEPSAAEVYGSASPPATGIATPEIEEPEIGPAEPEAPEIEPAE